MFGVLGFWVWVIGIGIRVLSLGFINLGIYYFRVWGLEFNGLGFIVEGFWIYCFRI